MNQSNDEKTITEKTIAYFNTNRDAIKISAIEKHALATTYQTIYAGNIYSCSVYYGEVTCKSPRVFISSESKTKAVTESVSPSNATEMSISQAQARLNELGYTVGQPDGVLGKKSIEKLKLFQRSRGLGISGKLDIPTVTALR